MISDKTFNYISNTTLIALTGIIKLTYKYGVLDTHMVRLHISLRLILLE